MVIPTNEHQSPAPLTVTVATARRMIGCGNTKMYELIGNGKVRAVKIAGRTLIEMASLHELVANAPAWKPSTRTN